MKIDKTTKKIALGTVIAAATGYVAGILTAPKSGKETRKDIKDTADKGIAMAEKQLKAVHSQLSEIISKGKEQLKKAKGVAKTDLSKAVEKATLAQGKAKEILSAVHEGAPQDKNLQKALDESKKALENLKAFLKK